MIFTLAISIYSLGFNIIIPPLIHTNTHITIRKRPSWFRIKYATKLPVAKVDAAIPTAVILHRCPLVQFSGPVLICYKWSILSYNTHTHFFLLGEVPVHSVRACREDACHYSFLASGVHPQTYISGGTEMMTTLKVHTILL